VNSAAQEDFQHLIPVTNFGVEICVRGQDDFWIELARATGDLFDENAMRGRRHFPRNPADTPKLDLHFADGAYAAFKPTPIWRRAKIAHAY
jgi:hypothetical protein